MKRTEQRFWCGWAAGFALLAALVLMGGRWERRVEAMRQREQVAGQLARWQVENPPLYAALVRDPDYLAGNLAALRDHNPAAYDALARDTLTRAGNAGLLRPLP